MKTINFLVITLAAFIFTISFIPSSYGNEVISNEKCSDKQCTETGCSKGNSGSVQGNSNCCSDKCTSESCKECCASGTCSLMNSSHSDKISNNNKNFTDNEIKSCCSENNNSVGNTKDCCK